MRIDSPLTSTLAAPLISARSGHGVVLDASPDPASSPWRTLDSPLVRYLSAHGQASSLPADEVTALMALANRQEVLFLAGKRELIIDVLRHSPWPLVADEDPDNDQARQIMQDARQRLTALLPAEVLEAATPAAGSHSEFFDAIAELIGNLDGELKSRYSDLLNDYVKFYKELTDILADLKAQLGKPDKDGMVEVDFTALRAKFDALRDKWAQQGFGAVFDSEAKARELLAELGIEGLTVIELPDGGGWQLSIDPDLINSLQHVFPYEVGPISATALNEMMAQKEIMMERFNFINRALPEKYQRRLQMWDSLVKLLSSAIDAVAEADRSFLSALAS